MPRPRTSIAWLMALSLISAVDCGFCRWTWRAVNQPGPTPGSLLVCVAVLPMLHILTPLTLSRFLGRPGSPRRRFLVGFEIAGWAAVLLVAVAFAVAPRSAHEVLHRVARPIVPWIEWLAPIDRIHRLPPVWRDAIELGLDLGLGFSILTAPQLLLAVIGGIIASCRPRVREFAEAEVVHPFDRLPVVP